jgi:sugar lactone lactonase YvrE
MRRIGRRRSVAIVLSAAAALLTITPASAQQGSFSTLITTPLAIEGLTTDGSSVYTTGRGATGPCPVWQINLASPSLVVVGLIPNPCNPSGLVFNSSGQLFTVDADRIYSLTPSAASPPTATVFASGVPGANGIAFDRSGNAWTGDGTTGQGRVWRVNRQGSQVTEAFRVPPIAIDTTVAGGIGRDVRTLPPGTIAVTPTTRNAADTAGSQPLVANGLAFDRRGDLFIADTARGAIWRVEIDNRGDVRSHTGCDDAYAPDTLCFENVFVAHPLLEGVDGIVFDDAGNLWCSVNERNAIVVVTPGGRVIEVFRNPRDRTTGLRNEGPLETPTSPVVVGKIVCTVNSDGNRRDNFPNTAGEITPAGPARGKISCARQR